MRGKYVLLLSALACEASAVDLGKVMCVGDSITVGGAGELYGLPEGYRSLLGSMLTADGDSFTYVGQSHDRPVTAHEGHTGWGVFHLYEGNASDPTSGKIQDWIARDNPDTILLMAGTNEGLRDEATMRSEYTTLFNTIYGLGPSTRVVWASLPASFEPNTLRQDWDPMMNNLIHTMAGEEKAQGRSVIYADVFDGFDFMTDLHDDFHPNNLGYAKIANSFHAAIVAGISPTPEPSTWAGLGVGLALITRRKRSDSQRRLRKA